MFRRVAFGIDLAGCTAGKSVCAAASGTDEQVVVEILQDCPFSRKIETDEELGLLVGNENLFLSCLLGIGPVAVDIPIDLQGLPNRVEAKFVWQLTLRPVDRYFGALPPLADKIGAPTARFQNILKANNLRGRLGDDLFETYPAASLKKLGLPHKGYKTNGQVAKREAAKATREEIADGLNIESKSLTDDELDATICAVTALAQPPARLEGPALSRCLSNQFPGLNVRAPDGYVLLQTNPYSRISVTRASASKWLEGKRIA